MFSMKALLLAILAVFVVAHDVQKVTDLPLDFDMPDMFSGYIDAEYKNTGKFSHIFHWTISAEMNPESAPVVFWFTGGPGCSSELALMVENGPFRLTDDLKLIKNYNSWNRAAHVVFIDQPIGTGFSYGDEGVPSPTNETMVADTMYNFFQGFMEAYPTLANRNVFITGESYGGHYVPAVTARLAEGNAKKEGRHINVKGMAIGNGWIDPGLQTIGYCPYALENHLIGYETFLKCNETAFECYHYTQTQQWEMADVVCGNVMGMILEEAGNINWYNIKLPCIGQLCYDFSNQINFMSQTDIQKALHVKHAHPWSPCSPSNIDTRDMNSNFDFDIIKVLDANLKVVIYNGMNDLICNFVGNDYVVSNMKWSGQAKMATAKWHDNGSYAFKVADNLALVHVPDAGHMVPLDQPEAALLLLMTFTNGGFF